MKRVIIAAMAVLVVGASLLGGVAIGQAQQLDEYKYRLSEHNSVYTICQNSRVHDTVSEERCWDAQKRHKIEFVCVEANKDPNNLCWTEENAELAE